MAQAADVPASLGYRISRFYRDEQAFIARLEPNATSRARHAPVRAEPGAGGTITIVNGRVVSMDDVDAPGDTCIDARIAERAPALPRLNGEFALAHYRPEQNKLLLTTDIAGMRSLYWHEADGVITAASSLRLLLAVRGIPDEPDLEALALKTVVLGCGGAGRSPYRHIRMLMPGEALEWRSGSSRRERWWNPVPTKPIRFARDEDYVEAARERLDRAVARRLPRSGTTLCQLSGGLDSSAVATSAAHVHDGPVHTLTMRPAQDVELPGAEPRYMHDEWPAVQSILSMYPSLIGHSAAPAMPTLRHEGPGGKLWSPEWPTNNLFQQYWLVEANDRLAREIDAQVVLTGGCGNATLSYNGRFALAEQIRELRLIEAWRNLAGTSPRWRHRARHLWSNGLWVQLPAVFRAALARARGGRTAMGACTPLRRDLFDRLDPDALALVPTAKTGSIDLDWQITAFDNYRNFNARAAATLREDQPWAVADPLGDLDLVEFCFAIPRDQYLRNGTERYLARRVLEGRVPRAVVAERRYGRANIEWFSWMSQHRDWLVGELERVEQSALAREMLDLDKMRRALADWPADATEAQRPERMNALHMTLGQGLRLGQFLVRIEGRNL